LHFLNVDAGILPKFSAVFPVGKNRPPMAEIHHIEDPDDIRVAEYIDLRDPELRRGREAASGFFVAESPHVIATVIRSGRRMRSLLVTPKQLDAMAGMLDALTLPVYVADASVLRRVVGFDLHRGAVAAVERWPLPPLSAVLAPVRRVAVLERVNDHENLGVLFRNAAAFGLDAIVLDSECSDPLYRRTVRVSIGHVCTVPWTRYRGVDELRAAGLAIVALTPAHDATPIDDVEWPDRSALVFGAEGPGLSDRTLAAADLRVRIPMRAGVDSLNVATAAAVAFYAATRAPDAS
jgi:tRNA G18 (ribose-2'-O)-methylase SpoU